MAIISDWTAKVLRNPREVRAREVRVCGTSRGFRIMGLRT